MAKPKDITAGVALMGFSGLIYSRTLGLAGASAAGGLGPASFPRALAVIIGVLAAALVVQGVVAKPAAGAEKKPLFGAGFGRMLGFFAALIIYIILMPFVGYLVPTSLFLFASMIIVMEKRSPAALAVGLLFSLVAAIAVYYVFAVFLDVPVIEGPVDEFFRYTVFKLGG